MMKRKYDLAISFAGEERDLARQIASSLRAAGFAVFFDEFEKAALWGEDLSARLEEIYSTAARFCLIIISASYAAKPWTTHERRSAIGRALQERTAYILPLRIDDTKLPGFPPVIGYIDSRTVPVQEVVALLSQKIGSPRGKRPRRRSQVVVSTDAIREVLSASYRRAIFARMHAQIDEGAMLQSMADCRLQLQRLIVRVEPEPLQQLVANVIGELDFIERLYANVSDYQVRHPETNAAKLRIIAALNELATQAGISFVLPTSVTEEVFFRREQADSPPEDQRQWGASKPFMQSNPEHIWKY